MNRKADHKGWWRDKKKSRNAKQGGKRNDEHRKAYVWQQLRLVVLQCKPEDGNKDNQRSSRHVVRCFNEGSNDWQHCSIVAASRV